MTNIILSKDGKIRLHRGHEIGKWEQRGLTFWAWFLLPEHQWKARLDFDTADVLLAKSKAEVRQVIADLYS